MKDLKLRIDSIVSLKTAGRFIAEEYQSQHPLRDKCPYLFSSLWEIRSEANDPALHFTWHALYVQAPCGHTDQRLPLCLLYISHSFVVQFAHICTSHLPQWTQLRIRINEQLVQRYSKCNRTELNH